MSVSAAGSTLPMASASSLSTDRGSSIPTRVLESAMQHVVDLAALAANAGGSVVGAAQGAAPELTQTISEHPELVAHALVTLPAIVSRIRKTVQLVHGGDSFPAAYRRVHLGKGPILESAKLTMKAAAVALAASSLGHKKP